MLEEAFDTIKGLIGSFPLTLLKDAEGDASGSSSSGSGSSGSSGSKQKADAESASAPSTVTITKNIVLKDGTYASVTSTEVAASHAAGGVPVTGGADEKMTSLRRLVCAGDILLGTVMCVSLTKITLRSKHHVNRLVADSVLAIAGTS